jgi:tetratricopeptide (TPR) repeat protein
MRLFTAFLAIAFTASAGVFAPSVEELIQHGTQELYAARYKAAADLYSEALKENPAHPQAIYGLVQALLHDHRSQEAYTAASDGLRRNPNSSSIQAAAGMAAYRQGQLTEAEKFLRAALQLNPQDSAALSGLSNIYSLISRFKTARELTVGAYRAMPSDPALMIRYAETLKGEERIRLLEQVLQLYDPGTEEAQDLRASIANIRAIADRKTRRLTSPYVGSQLKLFAIQDGVKVRRGFGLKAQFNGHETVTLLLDTGSSGISLSPDTIKKAGLQSLGADASQVRGVGEKSILGREYLASTVRIGPLAFEDYPVDAFETAKDSDVEGLIGADVFRDFIVSLDFPLYQLTLAPRTNYEPAEYHEVTEASTTLPSGFYRIYRLGNHLVIPTFVNSDKPSLFLLDSGASSNLIDTDFAQESTKVDRDERTIVRGIQGKVADTFRARHVTLRFAGFQQENQELVAIKLDKVSDSMGVAIHGILGMPILTQLKITIDYLEGAIRFDRPK